MRALITGVKGFVGKYLADYLLSQGIEVWGTSRTLTPFLHLNNGTVKVIENDLRDTNDIYNLLLSIKPVYIFHLAGQSNVKLSWENKEETFFANVNKTIFLLDACVKYQQENPHMRLLTVGSSEEYGKVASDELPIKETTPLRPMSPYGASKAVVSLLIQQYHKAHGLNVIHARPFNHIGPGQAEGFVTTDFAKQVVDIEVGNSLPQIKVGNLDVARDFMDVRDIVIFYYELIVRKSIDYGEVVNVCSGRAVKINNILEQLMKYSSKEIQIIIDKTKLRPVDIPFYFGENKKLKELTTHRSDISLEQSLSDILNSLRWSINDK